jgi:integrase
VRNVLATLRTILNTAVEWGALEHLPRFPKIKTTESAFDFYNSEEASLLIASARDDERILLRFALHTGARAGEQLALDGPTSMHGTSW